MSPRQSPLAVLPPPWLEFLQAVDKALPRPVELHCLGGFVLVAVYGSPHLTADLDHIAVVPNEELTTVQEVAGSESELSQKYRIHIQYAGVTQYPENYESRLHDIFPGRFSKLRLLALDAHDIVLSKLSRNFPVDDRDCQFLVRLGVLDPATLRERYERELRPYLSNPERHDTTLHLWLEYFQQ